MTQEFERLVRDRARKKILFLPHAVGQTNRPDRMISPAEVRKVVQEGDIIEDYPEDARGHSCLMLGFGEQERPIHVVCSPKDEYLAIVTAHVPSRARWDDGFRTRRTR